MTRRGSRRAGRVATARLAAVAGACVVAAAAASAPAAPARAGDGLRSGVVAAGLVPEGLALIEAVVSSSSPATALRLGAPGPQPAQAVAQVEVLVAPSIDEAAAWLGFEASAATHPLPALSALGDEARGDAGLVLLRRDNLAARIHTRDGLDARALARHVDERFAEAPLGDPRAVSVPALEAVTAPGADVPHALRLPAALLAAAVRVEGPGYARRTRDGWRVVRTGQGPLRVVTVRVDRMLRVAGP